MTHQPCQQYLLLKAELKLNFAFDNAAHTVDLDYAACPNDSGLKLICIGINRLTHCKTPEDSKSLIWSP